MVDVCCIQFNSDIASALIPNAVKCTAAGIAEKRRQAIERREQWKRAKMLIGNSEIPMLATEIVDQHKKCAESVVDEKRRQAKKKLERNKMIIENSKIPMRPSTLSFTSQKQRFAEYMRDEFEKNEIFTHNQLNLISVFLGFNRNFGAIVNSLNEDGFFFENFWRFI